MSQKSVAEAVLGITDPANHLQSMQQAHYTLTGESLTAQALLDERDRNLLAAQNPLTVTLRERQRYNDFRNVASLLETGTSYSNNTFMSWPYYQDTFEKYGQPAESDTNALLIGAYTPLSARSFCVFAKDVYRATHAYVVDVQGTEDVQRHGTFMYGSGLELPFETASVDFVHTNQLLHMLRDPGNSDRPDKQKTLMLLREIGRILAPGGQLMMQEFPPNMYKLPSTTEKALALLACGKLIEQRLLQSGFEKAVASFSHGSTELARLLFDPQRNFDIAPTGYMGSAAMIYGRKQSQVGPIAVSGKRQPIALGGRLHEIPEATELESN